MKLASLLLPSWFRVLPWLLCLIVSLIMVRTGIAAAVGSFQLTSPFTVLEYERGDVKIKSEVQNEQAAAEVSRRLGTMRFVPSLVTYAPGLLVKCPNGTINFVGDWIVVNNYAGRFPMQFTARCSKKEREELIELVKKSALHGIE